MALKPFFTETGARTSEDDEIPPAQLGVTRSEAVQRLQIGIVGLGGMLLLIGLANVITDRAQQTSDQAVPEATPPAIAEDAPAQSDPLADAGVVPELPAEPDAEEAAADAAADADDTGVLEEDESAAEDAAQ